MPGYIYKARAEEAPSIEFLEFIGQGVQVDDEYLDPVNYQDMDSLVESEQKQSSTSLPTHSPIHSQEQTDE